MSLITLKETISKIRLIRVIRGKGFKILPSSPRNLHPINRKHNRPRRPIHHRQLCQLQGASTNASISSIWLPCTFPRSSLIRYVNWVPAIGLSPTQSITGWVTVLPSNRYI